MSLSPITSYATAVQAPAVTDTAAQARRAAAPVDTTVSSLAPVAPALTTAVKQVAATDQLGATKDKADNAKLDQAVAAINKFLAPIASSIEFSIDEESGRTLVKVVDTDTNAVLRQFPSKEALDISHQLDKLQGLLLKEKA